MPDEKQKFDKEKDGHFVLIQKIAFADLDKNDAILLESDLCLQDSKYIYQYKYIDSKEDTSAIIRPGVHRLNMKPNYEIETRDMQLRTTDIKKDLTNVSKIYDEAGAFFDNLHIYEELGETKARKILLFSDPGMGKTSTIASFCSGAVKEDPNTAVIVWPTSSIGSDDVLEFLSSVKYDEQCTRLILVMEDIGGGEREGDQASRSVDSALLDILDGIGVTMPIPTLMIATTNYPQNLLSALADRPGRFDMMMKLDPPSPEERVQVLEFIAKRKLTEEEANYIRDKKINDFSVAHLKEALIRSLLHKKTLKETIDELIQHKKNFKSNYQDGTERVGF